MAIYEIVNQEIRPIERTTFEKAGLRERSDLQRMLLERISVVLPDVLVIAEEFGDWEDSRRRVDLLGVERDGSLVVIELKRTEDGGHMELQALRYAAMVSAMTFEQAVDTYRTSLEQRGIDKEPRDELLAFLEWQEPDEERFAWNVKIALVSADFSRELTTAVLWLNQRDVDIRCIRVRPFADGERILLDVQQVIPLPEAEEYQVRLRQKAVSERASRAGHDSRSHRYHKFWTQLLIRAKAKTDLHGRISAGKESWLAAINHGVYLSYVISRGRARVELYLGRTDAAENLAIYRELEAATEQIEGALGEPIDWQELEGKKACRIAVGVAGPTFEEEVGWSELQDLMIDKMIKLEAAARPYLGKYRTGAKPDTKS